MENINFKIDHIDLLGQGVSKYNEIIFIGKTLPGEVGIAEIYRKAKGVIFARLTSPDKLKIVSQKRIVPECPHYYKCSACQFLHTEYKNEIDFKANSLKKIFTEILQEPPKIKVHSAKQRFGYRNRVQIHYDLEIDSIGFISSFSGSLIDASECLLPTKSIRDILKNFYTNDKWKKKINKENYGKKGYIELYLKQGKSIPEINVNRPYADGGFTQVNDKMGVVLTDLVTKIYKKTLHDVSDHLVLDIFGGNGNLSANFENASIKVYDCHTDKTSRTMGKINQKYICIDLYKKDPVNKIKASLKDAKRPYIIIFNPPRAGVKFIDSYIKYLDAPYIFYVSCNPATLRRDMLKIIAKYSIIEIHLIDLFPGTRHFETLIVFRKKVANI